MELRPRFPGSQRPGIRPPLCICFTLPNKASALCILLALGLRPRAAWVKRQPWASWPSAAIVKRGIINHTRTVAPIAFFADIGLREGCLEQTLEPGGVWGDETNYPPHASFIHPSMTFTYYPPPLIGHGDTSRNKWSDLCRPSCPCLCSARHKGVMSRLCQRSRRIHNAQPWPQCSAVSLCPHHPNHRSATYPAIHNCSTACASFHLRPEPCSLFFSLSYFIFCGLIAFCPPSPSIVRRIAWFHGRTANGMRSGFVSSSS